MIYAPTHNTLIVKIYDVDKEKKNTSRGGIITMNVLKPLMNNCGIGEAISVGRDITDIKEKDIVLFHHLVEDTDYRYLCKDDEGEYRVVHASVPETLIKDKFKDFPPETQKAMMHMKNRNQVYGVVKNSNSGSRIIPHIGYIMADPAGLEHNYSHKVFQVQVDAINSLDRKAKEYDLKNGDWILCPPYAAYSISIDRQEFWFIRIDDIIAINKGRHRVSPLVKMTANEGIRLASRNEYKDLTLN